MRFSNTKLQSDFVRNIKFRSILIFSVFTFFFVLFAYKAFQLQVSQTDPKLKSLLDNQLTSKIRLTPQRGEILDQNMKELALSIKMDSLYAHPREIKNKREVANFLSKVLKQPEAKFLKKLSSKSHFVWIKRLLEPEIARTIRDKNIKGLNFIPESNRFYPNKNLAGSTIGFVGFDSRGLEGLELKYDNKLLGKEQFFKIQTDARGRPILAIVQKHQTSSVAEMLFANYIATEHIVLTLDKELQYWAEKELEKAILTSEAPRGEIIVLDPTSGKILAIANYPYFNPNNFSKYPQHTYRNRSVTDMFDPGSTFKLFTIAAALEAQKITPDTKFDCENGLYVINKRTKIREAMYKKFKILTAKEIIQHSSNIGIVKIGELLDSNAFYNFILKFGFNNKTGIDLPGESSGRVRSPDLWNAVDKANVSFGQGISVTSIQLVSAFAALINGGTLYKPYVVEKIVDNRHNIIEKFRPIVIRAGLISKNNSDKMKLIMKSVLEPEGTGRNAYIEGFSVGGKTGTAQKFDFTDSKYFQSRYISSFIGAFPLENPKYVIFVKIDDPMKNKYASLSAAPSFKNIAKYLINDLNRKNKVQKFELAVSTKNITATVNPFETDKILKLKTKIVNHETLFEVPNLKTLSLREALRIFNDTSFEYDISGSGKIIHQSPEPGSYVAKGTKISLKLKPRSSF